MSSISQRFRLTVPHGQLAECIASLEEALGAMQETGYHQILGRNFLHQTADAADYLTTFHRTASTETTVSALYFEMNGFTVNTDLWYFDGFAYAAAGDIWDLEWLCDMDASTKTHFPLRGMEAVQGVFEEHYGVKDQLLSLALAAELAEHLVTARHMELVAAAHEHAKLAYAPLRGLPVLATAHDWDIVHRTT